MQPIEPTSDPSSISAPIVVTPIVTDGPAAAAVSAQTTVVTSDQAAAVTTNQAATVTTNQADACVVQPRERVEIWNMPFDVVTLDESIDAIGELILRREPSYVITANLNYVMLHNKRDALREVTRDADLIVADGQPIVWRSKLGTVPLKERVAGSEMIYSLAQRASESQWSIYFLGGEPGVAEACATQLVRMYPGLKIAGVESPPFRALSSSEQQAQDQRIQSSGADLLLVAFGQPKGEQWIHENYQRLGVPVSIQLGASFDFVAGTAQRAPAIWQTIGMEWFYRMLSDPKRLVPRYVSNAWFLCTALADDWKRKVQSWGMGLDDECARSE